MNIIYTIYGLNERFRKINYQSLRRLFCMILMIIMIMIYILLSQKLTIPHVSNREPRMLFALSLEHNPLKMAYLLCQSTWKMYIIILLVYQQHIHFAFHGKRNDEKISVHSHIFIDIIIISSSWSSHLADCAETSTIAISGAISNERFQLIKILYIYYYSM